MSIRAVHWHEGMFLRPQHFQAAQRYSAHQSHRAGRWALHYHWGLRSIAIDREALANHRLVIHRLEAWLRDGTLVSIPDDGALPELDLKSALERDPTLTVLLAVPSLRVGRANVSANSQAEGGRYLVDTQEVEDENTGLHPQPLDVRLLNVKLLLSTGKEQPGYEVLPIARIDKGTDANTTPRIDVTYIPPLLACEAWAPLHIDILKTIYDRIGVNINLLANQVVNQGIAVGSSSIEDARIIGFLGALNEAYSYLGTLFFAEGIHPLDAYLELCGLIGRLSIFSSTHRPPELPRYDHDDLSRFYKLKRYIDALLEIGGPPPYEQRPFESKAKRMQVVMEPLWMEPIYQMFVGVQTTMPADQCVSLLTTQGQLDMKIGGGGSDGKDDARVDRVYEGGQAGLKFTAIPHPPRALPGTGWIYFQVAKDAQPQEWQYVRQAMTLAIRLNEHRILGGNIQGEKTLTIRQAGQNVTLRLTLFVLKPT